MQIGNHPESGDPLIRVAIYLKGCHLKPDDISQKLGIQPSEYQTKGELRPGSSKFIARIGLWALVSQVDSLKVEDHLDDLLGKFSGLQENLNNLDLVEEAYLDIFVATNDEPSTRKTIEFSLRKRHLEEINRLGLTVACTLH